jgi:hypothetical protein
MTALHITTADETGEFRYGVDYLGYWMKKAVFDWEERFPDRPLESIDVIAHSTGGLVTRAYIQSPAYNQTFDNAGHTLPRIRKFVMYDVPNQGAAKAWGFLKNTWMGDGSALDAASYNATSKLVSNAFRKMLDGEPIRGADRNITLDELLETVPSERRWLVTYDLQNDTDWSGREAEEIRRRFIDQFCPTIRSLLSTYPFLRDENGTLIDVNLDQNQRNNLLLDLNGRSTDMNWFATQVESVINVYANGVSTITERTELTGTLLPSGDLQVGFHETIPTHPDWGEIWYRADIDAHGGDGTVPYVSLVGQFLDDPRVLKLEFVIDPTFATPNFGRSDLVTTLLPGDPSDPAKTISHTTIVANPHVIQAILARLGHPLPIEQVSSGHQLSPRAGVWNGARLGYLDLAIDPIDAYLVDQQGRRLGYTTAEGRLEEIPGSSYFGATLGFGQLLALEDELEPISPFRLELQGSGSTFTVQVSNWYSDRFLPGLTMRGFLAPQQRMSVLVPTQDPAIPGPPQANDESVTTTTGRGIYVPVLQNDVAHNMRLDRSSVVITRFSSHGEIEVDSLTGEVLYRPEFGFTGIDSFEYMFLDQEGVSSNSGHVTIEVVSGPGNQAPLALSDHLTGSMNTLLIIDGLANDSDPDGVLRSTALSIERLPSHGTLSFDETLTRFVYVPAPDFVGDDSFAYKVRDDAGEWSNLAEVSIDVTSPSLPPTALDDDVRSESGVVTRFPVLENDFDIDGTLNPSTVTIVTQPSRGSATLDPESGEIIYTADPGASGQDLLTYFVRDDTGVASNIASVFVTLIEPSVPLELLAFDIQRGAAQRSFIRFVGLQFNSSGGLESLRASMTNESPEDDRLRLRRFELDGTGGTFAPFASSILIDGASVELDFGILGLGGNPTSALGDGHYILEVDLDGNGTFDTSRRFYRLLGDANGDHQVDDMDLALVNSALGRTGTSLEEDVNGDGVVNQIDRILVRRARGRRLGSGLIIDD